MDESQRKEVKVSVVHIESCSGSLIGDSWKDDTVLDVIAWLRECLEQVPEQYRAETRFAVENVYGWGESSHPEVEIYYMRPETDTEMTARLALERQRREDCEHAERRQLAELRAKYGG